MELANHIDMVMVVMLVVVMVMLVVVIFMVVMMLVMVVVICSTTSRLFPAQLHRGVGTAGCHKSRGREENHLVETKINFTTILFSTFSSS